MPKTADPGAAGSPGDILREGEDREGESLAVGLNIPGFRRGEGQGPSNSEAELDLVRGGLTGRAGGLAGDLSAESANQSVGFRPHPLVAGASRLTVPSNFLGVSSVEIGKDLRHEDSGKTKEECYCADIQNPGNGHGISSGFPW
jgi:hypothetical protein